MRTGNRLKVPAPHVAQTCSACGPVDSRSRQSQACFRCTHCGFGDHADINPARSILRRSAPAQIIAIPRTAVMPVDTGDEPAFTGELLSEAGTLRALAATGGCRSVPETASDTALSPGGDASRRGSDSATGAPRSHRRAGPWRSCPLAPRLQMRSRGHRSLSERAYSFPAKKKLPETRPRPSTARKTASTDLIPAYLAIRRLAAGIPRWFRLFGRTDLPRSEMQDFLPEGFRRALRPPGSRCDTANTDFRSCSMPRSRQAADAHWRLGCLHACFRRSGRQVRETGAEDCHAEIGGVPMFQLPRHFRKACHDRGKRPALLPVPGIVIAQIMGEIL